MYKMTVETQIKSQWSYSDALGNYEAIVIVNIRNDGTVLETRFIKPSGNKIFDESVLKAIEKAKPLPPLPEGYEKSYEEIKINFNLKDLE
jgi:colicin import membrane protein